MEQNKKSENVAMLGGLLSSELDLLFLKPHLLDKPSAWFGHIPFAHWLIGCCRPKLFVELGAHAGVSYTAFCAAVAKEQTGTECFAVDTWTGDDHAGQYDAQIFEELKKFNDQHFGHFSTLIKSTFDGALDFFQDYSIDLLHIDGFHTYEAVSHDFNTWLPKLSNRAVVLFHDTNEYQKDFGVWRLWSELRTRYPSFEFSHSHGLGILAIGERVPDTIKELCKLDGKAEAYVIRDRFKTIGDFWSLEARAIDEKAQLEKAKTLVAEKARAIKEAEHRAARLESEKMQAMARAREAEQRAARFEIEKTQTMARAREAEQRAARLESEKTQTMARAREAEQRAARLDSEKTQALERLKETGQQVAGLENEKLAMLASSSWRLTKPLRAIRRTLISRPYLFFRKYLSDCARWFWHSLPLSTRFRLRIKNTLFRSFPTFLGWTQAYRDWKQFNTTLANPSRENSALLGAPVQKSVDDHPSPENRNNYQEWIRRYDTLTEQLRSDLSGRAEELPNQPLISVVMPAYNPKPEWLIEAIESVRNQIYTNWELCIADDASTDEFIRPILERYECEDARIKVVIRTQNGHISAATNSALKLASGEWIALLDHDDLLSEHALFWVAQAVNENPDAGMVYSDEDKIDSNGQRCSPYFKSDWNPFLFRSHNMICHLGCYKKTLVDEIGGFRLGFEGAQDYDLALRCSERLSAEQIVHIPRVLYHWRIHPDSTAHQGSVKPFALVAGATAINEHLTRCGLKAQAELLDSGMYRVRYSLPDIKPLVSLIIPTRNAHNLVKQCIESILSKTTYPNYEILLIDNGSDNPDSLAYFRELERNPAIRIIRDDRPFNYSALNNAAVAQAKGELIGLINNDVEVITPDWLSEMVSLACLPRAGAVGARLWYPNNRLQHGGVITGIGGVAGHSHKNILKGDSGYFARASLIQGLSAVTAACLVIKKDIFESVQGLDESLRIAFNDVDFCLRVREAGYQNIWTPYAELYHHESATRGYEDNPEKQARFTSEISFMQQRWGNALLYDPAYNPNLTVYFQDFSLAWPPRISV